MPLEDWELDSGFREDYILNINAAHFAPDAAYQDGNVLLIHLVGTDDSDGADVEERMSIGADWQTVDGGRTVQHPSKTKINKSSRYGRWIEAAKSVPGLMDILVDRGSPTDATVWEGLKLHIKATEFPSGNLNEGRPFRWNMPVEYLGLTTSNESTTIATPAPVQQSLTAVQILEQAKTKQSSTQPSNPIIDQLIQLAKANNTHEEFVAAAVQIQEVLVDDELAAKVMDPSDLYMEARK